MTPHRPDRLSPAMSGAVALLACGALLPVLAVLGELRPTWLALAAYATVCAALGRYSRPAAAPLIALSGWLFHNGFVEHRHGVLGWSGPGTEAARFLLLAVAALLLSLPGSLPRPVLSTPRARTRRRRAA
ncbi:hypothetical protein [Kitasatospora sp. NPDC050463]|uniref:hypothetical protein n=1 Tax=Kitasatospora sp. NPDC050463 TaxID=3155786 RepID=UPI00340B9097